MIGGAEILIQSCLLPKPTLFHFCFYLIIPLGVMQILLEHTGQLQFVFFSLGNKTRQSGSNYIVETGYFPFKIYMVNTHCQIFLDSMELSLISKNVIEVHGNHSRDSLCLLGG